jgi:hypothetical protein
MFLIACSGIKNEKIKPVVKKIAKQKNKHSQFNKYWSQGKAEITSYRLTQVRYGELHQGNAIKIFVTENFLPNKQVKADTQDDQNIPILKLNSTKKFFTGIYPYSIMTSTFSPINKQQPPIKISFSSQEWCGNTFIQLNNHEDFEIDFYSYFESDYDRKESLKKSVVEDDLWNQLRISPDNMPLGKLEIIPSFEFLALHHKKIKSYKAKASLTTDTLYKKYTIEYIELDRTLKIVVDKYFPFGISSWEETLRSRGEILSTKGERIKTILSAYWTKNGVQNTSERKELGL